MNFCPIRDIQDYYIRLTSDDSGKLSLAKSILFWGSFSAGIIVWKMAILGTLTAEIFGLFLAFVSGHTLTSKWLDGKAQVSDNIDK